MIVRKHHIMSLVKSTNDKRTKTDYHSQKMQERLSSDYTWLQTLDLALITRFFKNKTETRPRPRVSPSRPRPRLSETERFERGTSLVGSGGAERRWRPAARTLNAKLQSNFQEDGKSFTLMKKSYHLSYRFSLEI